METPGIINQELRLVKKDEELIRAIIKKRGWSEESYDRVRDMLRYNVLTMKQASEITGLDVTSIANKLRPKVKNGEMSTELDSTYPFKTLDEVGPKFIVRNEKFESQIKKYI